MKTNCLKLILSLAALSAAGSVYAADDAASPQPSPHDEKETRAGTNLVTVEALVGKALAKNPELEFYRAEIVAAKAGRKT